MPEKPSNGGRSRPPGGRPPGSRPPERHMSERPPLKRREMDGVIFEPSSRVSPSGPSNAPRRPQAPPAGRPRAKKKKVKSQFAIFYIITLITAVVICLVLFAMAFSAITSRNPVIEGTVKPTVTPLPGIEESDIQKTLGLVTAVDLTADPGTVTLMDLETGRESTYTLLTGTDIKNRFGSPMVPSDIARGRIMEAGYASAKNTLATLYESAQAWDYPFKSNVKIDTEKGTLTLGNEVYTYDSQTLVLYQNEPYPIGYIRPIDTVSLTGYADKVWCVLVESNHGFLRLENMDMIVNGTLAVDTSIFMGLGDMTEPIALAEGTHRVIVEGSNIEPYITDVVIRSNETASVNLIDVQLRLAKLTVTVNEPDSTIIVDGTPLIGTTSVELEFGTHTVRVEKDGFNPVEQEVNLSRPQTEVSFTLAPIPKAGRLILYTTPSQAEIYVDGAFVGFSTLTHELGIGTHSVTARKNGYTDNTISVTIGEGDNSYYLILTENVTDPFAHLPVPSASPLPSDQE